jgi:hypothetical protein
LPEKVNLRRKKGYFGQRSGGGQSRIQPDNCLWGESAFLLETTVLSMGILQQLGKFVNNFKAGEVLPDYR